jgi:hypothetical protein
MKNTNIFCLVALLMAAGAASAQTKPLKNTVPSNANLATDGKTQQAKSNQSSTATVKQNNNVDVVAKAAPSSKKTENTSVSNTAAESKSSNNQAATSKMQNVSPKSGILVNKKKAAKATQTSSTDK